MRYITLLLFVVAFLVNVSVILFKDFESDKLYYGSMVLCVYIVVRAYMQFRAIQQIKKGESN
jgi:hypothetical protein